MGTAANIIHKDADGNFQIVYCHYDGYILGVGKTLLENYSSEAQVKKLFKQCDGRYISCLGNTIANTEFMKDDSSPTIQDHLDDFWMKYSLRQDYNYVFEDGVWKIFRRRHHKAHLVIDSVRATEEYEESQRRYRQRV